MNEIIADLRVLGIDIYHNLLKYPLQRLVKGYCDKDLWELDVYMARRILPALIAFRNNKQSGYPSGMKNQKEWLETIDKMIFGLGCVLNGSDIKGYEKAKEGLELLGKHFLSLWD